MTLIPYAPRSIPSVKAARQTRWVSPAVMVTKPGSADVLADGLLVARAAGWSWVILPCRELTRTVNNVAIYSRWTWTARNAVEWWEIRALHGVLLPITQCEFSTIHAGRSSCQRHARRVLAIVCADVHTVLGVTHNICRVGIFHLPFGGFPSSRTLHLFRGWGAAADAAQLPEKWFALIHAAMRCDDGSPMET